MTIKDLAKNLRKNQTDAERHLWQYLRDRRLSGYKFCRQYYVGEFITDFICIEKNLIVEIDGGQHDENADADRIRTNILERHGFTVIRFWNNEVFNNTDEVLNVINDCLITPNPLPLRGEGI